MKHLIVEALDRWNRGGIVGDKYCGVQLCFNSHVKILTPARELVVVGVLEWRLDLEALDCWSIGSMEQRLDH